MTLFLFFYKRIFRTDDEVHESTCYVLAFALGLADVYVQ